MQVDFRKIKEIIIDFFRYPFIYLVNGPNNLSLGNFEEIKIYETCKHLELS
jgi:hypothetical protein